MGVTPAPLIFREEKVQFSAQYMDPGSVHCEPMIYLALDRQLQIAIIDSVHSWISEFPKLSTQHWPYLIGRYSLSLYNVRNTLISLQDSLVSIMLTLLSFSQTNSLTGLPYRPIVIEIITQIYYLQQ